MRGAILLVAMLLPLSASADEWKELLGYSLYDLYQMGVDDEVKEAAKERGTPRKASVLSTNEVQLQGGRFALITSIEVFQGDAKSLYRCFDYYSPKAVRTSQTCYELRK